MRVTISWARSTRAAWREAVRRAFSSATMKSVEIARPIAAAMVKVRESVSAITASGPAAFARGRGW